jgi:thioredoxin reductase (NADPH)
MKQEKHDLVIVGSGASGISAAIYAARYKMDFLIVGRLPGGNMSESYDVENYPGLEETVPGHVLADRMLAQLERFGHRPKMDEIQSVKKHKGEYKFSLLGNNTEYLAKTLLLAVGMERNRLNIPGEKEFEGRGVAYCATCDGYFYKEKVVAVIGGGDSALTAAIYLADIATEVYLIVRRDEFRGEPTWIDKVNTNKKIKIMLKTSLKEITGTDKVEKIILEDGRKIKVDGVFIEIGQTPQTVILKQLGIKTDDKGVVVVKDNQKTSVRGVWAAGDITNGSNGLRQIVTGSAEGAVASVDIYSELKKSK